MAPPTDFLGVWAFLAMNIAAPGPNVINTISTSMQDGRAAGLAMGVGLGVALRLAGAV